MLRLCASIAVIIIMLVLNSCKSTAVDAELSEIFRGYNTVVVVYEPNDPFNRDFKKAFEGSDDFKRLAKAGFRIVYGPEGGGKEIVPQLNFAAEFINELAALIIVPPTVMPYPDLLRRFKTNHSAVITVRNDLPKEMKELRNFHVGGYSEEYQGGVFARVVGAIMAQKGLTRGEFVEWMGYNGDNSHMLQFSKGFNEETDFQRSEQMRMSPQGIPSALRSRWVMDDESQKFYLHLDPESARQSGQIIENRAMPIFTRGLTQTLLNQIDGLDAFIYVSGAEAGRTTAQLLFHYVDRSIEQMLDPKTDVLLTPLAVGCRDEYWESLSRLNLGNIQKFKFSDFPIIQEYWGPFSD